MIQIFYFSGGEEIPGKDKNKHGYPDLCELKLGFPPISNLRMFCYYYYSKNLNGAFTYSEIFVLVVSTAIKTEDSFMSAHSSLKKLKIKW